MIEQMCSLLVHLVYVWCNPTTVFFVVQEIFQVRDHKDNLSCIAISSSFDKAASAGDNRFSLLFNWV